jgi:hypothetical protein
MNEWNIQSRATACESCQRAFADKEAYHTLLFDEKQDYRRMDVCTGCWEHKHADDTARKGFVSHWQGVFEAPVVAADPIQKETAESLLRKIIELNDPKYVPAAFILAVMLERKRVFKVKEQFRREGQRVFLYEQPRTGDVFTIADPDLQLNQLDQVQQDVATLLEHGLNPPAPGLEPAAGIVASEPVAMPASTPVDAESSATVTQPASA